MYLEQKRQNKISLTLLADAGPNPDFNLELSPFCLPKSNNKPTQKILDTPHIQDLTQKFENMTPIFSSLDITTLGPPSKWKVSFKSPRFTKAS